MCAYNLNKNMLNTTIKYTPNHYSNVRNNLSFHIDSFPFLRASACSLSTIHYMQVSNWWRSKSCHLDKYTRAFLSREMSFFIFFFHNCVLLISIISIVHSIRAFHSNSFMINIVNESGEEQNKSGYINCYVKVNSII